MICLKLATRTGSFQVDVDATPPDCGVANINYERKPLAVPGTWNTGTNYADSRYQLPRIDTSWCAPTNSGYRVGYFSTSTMINRLIGSALRTNWYTPIMRRHSQTRSVSHFTLRTNWFSPTIPLPATWLRTLLLRIADKLVNPNDSAVGGLVADFLTPHCGQVGAHQ